MINKLNSFHLPYGSVLLFTSIIATAFCLYQSYLLNNYQKDTIDISVMQVDLRLNDYIQSEISILDKVSSIFVTEMYHQFCFEQSEAKSERIRHIDQTGKNLLSQFNLSSLQINSASGQVEYSVAIDNQYTSFSNIMADSDDINAETSTIFLRKGKWYIKRKIPVQRSELFKKVIVLTKQLNFLEVLKNNETRLITGEVLNDGNLNIFEHEILKNPAEISSFLYRTDKESKKVYMFKSLTNYASENNMILNLDASSIFMATKVHKQQLLIVLTITVLFIVIAGFLIMRKGARHLKNLIQVINQLMKFPGLSENQHKEFDEGNVLQLIQKTNQIGKVVSKCRESYLSIDESFNDLQNENRALLDAVPLPLIVIKSDGTVNAFNRKFMDLFPIVQIDMSVKDLFMNQPETISNRSTFNIESGFSRDILNFSITKNGNYYETLLSDLIINNRISYLAIFIDKSLYYKNLQNLNMLKTGVKTVEKNLTVVSWEIEGHSKRLSIENSSLLNLGESITTYVNSIYKFIDEWVHPDYIKGMNKKIELLLADGSKIFSMMIQSKNEELKHRWFKFVSLGDCSLFQEETSVFYIGYIQDVTDAQLLNTQHKASEKQLKNLKEIIVGREQRLLELKMEVNALNAELNRDPDYLSVIEQPLLLTDQDKEIKQPQYLSLLKQNANQDEILLNQPVSRLIGIIQLLEENLKKAHKSSLSIAEDAENNRKRAEVASKNSEEVNKQLQSSLSEVERFNNLMFKRESRILEIKDEVNLLLFTSGKSKKYKVTASSEDKDFGDVNRVEI